VPTAHPYCVESTPNFCACLTIMYKHDLYRHIPSRFLSQPPLAFSLPPLPSCASAWPSVAPLCTLKFLYINSPFFKFYPLACIVPTALAMLCISLAICSTTKFASHLLSILQIVPTGLHRPYRPRNAVHQPGHL